MWETVKLGDVCSFTRGLTYSKKDEEEISDIAVLRATNIDLSTHTLLLDEIRYISENVKVKEDKFAKLDDILICTASGSKKHLGKVALITENTNMAFGGFMGALRAQEGCLAAFLFKILLSDKFKHHLNSLSEGANINNLKFSQIESFEFPLPPLAEQQRIVAKLDAAFAEIDTAIAAAEKNAENVRSVFEHELENVFLSSTNEWKRCKVKDVGKAITGSTPKTSVKENYGDFIPFIKPADFFPNGSLNYENEALSELGAKSARITQPHSVLMVCIGATIGKVGYCDEEVSSNQQINSLMPFNGFNYKFIYFQMRSKSFQKTVIDASGQATLPIINKTKWEALTLVFPTTEIEQKFISDSLELLETECAEAQRLYLKKSKELNILKSALLTAALTQQSEAA